MIKKIKYLFITTVKTLFTLLLLVSFLLSSTPVKALIQSAQSPDATGTAYSKKGRHVAAADKTGNSELSEKEENEEPDPDTDGGLTCSCHKGGGLWYTAEVFPGQYSESARLHLKVIPLYILLHSWKSDLFEPERS